MRKSAILILFIAAIGMSLLPGCGGDPDPVQETEEERVRKLLIGNWNVQSVTVDGVDRTEIYQDIQLNITATTIAGTNGGLMWPGSVSWDFTNSGANQISRTDGLSLSIIDVQPSRLQISLLWDKDTFGPGRATSVEGQHVFVFDK
jgi:hypothetical protein